MAQAPAHHKVRAQAEEPGEPPPLWMGQKITTFSLDMNIAGPSRSVASAGHDTSNIGNNLHACVRRARAHHPFLGKGETWEPGGARLPRSGHASIATMGRWHRG
jgi:hypothetical protein